MKQESGNNSRNIQVAGDMHIGITVTEALEISKMVVKQELDLYTKDALKTAEDRFKAIANRTVDRINSDRPDLFPKFKDPAIQIALYETYKKYIETGDDELGDNLINMLIDRLEIEHRCTKQFVIDDARIILSKLSTANLSFLALYVFALLNIPTNQKNDYVQIIKKLNKIVEQAALVTDLDLAYLKQTGCAMGVAMIHVNQHIAESLLKTYEYYFSSGITLDLFNQLSTKHHINLNEDSFISTISLADNLPDNMVGLRFSSEMRFYDFFSTKNLPDIKSFFEEFIARQNKANVNDVKQFHISLDGNWQKVFALWDKESVSTLSIMPVGLYIGSVYLSRALGIKIPQDIFYGH